MFPQDKKGLAVVGGELKPYKKYFTAYDYTPWMKPRRKDVGVVPPCVYGQPVIDFFNKAEVRTALHIPESI